MQLNYCLNKIYFYLPPLLYFIFIFIFNEKF